MLGFKKMHLCAPSMAIAAAEHMRAATADRELSQDLSTFDPSYAGLDLHSRFYRRPDLDEDVADMLEMGAGWDSLKGVASLISGHTALGGPIAGVERRADGRNWADALGIEPGLTPNRDDLEAIIVSRRRADGRDGDDGFARARRGLMVFTGTNAVKDEALGEILDIVAAGRKPDGRPLTNRDLLEAVSKPRSADVAAILFSFNAAKSHSAALALCRGIPRAILVEVHREGVIGGMRDVEMRVGQIRRGDGGKSLKRARPAWFGCTHFTSRPTWREGVRIAGDPHLHDHVMLLAAALDEDGRAGKLDLAPLHAHVAEIGAMYHFRTAAKLREAGIAVSLHPRQDCLRLEAVPLPLEELFSKRTQGGKQQAESFAASSGLQFDALTVRQRTKLIKLGVQGDPLAPHKDDIADPADWRAQAEAAGFDQPVLIGRPSSLKSGERDVQIDAAVAQAGLILERASPPTPQVAATLASLAVGLSDAADTVAVAARLPQRSQIRGYDPLALARANARTAPIEARRFRQKAIGGELRLVPGGREGVATVAAALWCTRSLEGAIRSPVQVSSYEDVETIETEIRRRLLADGSLGRRHIDVPLVGPRGVTRIDLRVGEIVAFTSPVNGRSASGHGRIGGSGTSARVLDFDGRGLEIETARGQATISWYALSNPATGAMSLSLGYAARWPCPTDRAGIAAILEGSHSARRLGLPDDATLLLDLDLERSHRTILEGGRGGSGDDELLAWTIDNLAGFPRSSLVELVGSVKCRTAILHLLYRHAEATGEMDLAGALRARRRGRSDGLARLAEGLAARCDASRGAMVELSNKHYRELNDDGRVGAVLPGKGIRAPTSRAFPPRPVSDPTVQAGDRPAERAPRYIGNQSAPASTPAVATPPAAAAAAAAAAAVGIGTITPSPLSVQLGPPTRRPKQSDKPTIGVAARPHVAVQGSGGLGSNDPHLGSLDEDDALFEKAFSTPAVELASVVAMREVARRIAAPTIRQRLLAFAQRLLELLDQRGSSMRRVAVDQRPAPQPGEGQVSPGRGAGMGAKRKGSLSRSGPAPGGSDRGR